MANIEYHHGVTIKNSTDVTPRIRLKSDTVIAVFGTTTTFKPSNESYPEYALIRNDGDIKNLGEGTLITAIKAIYAQAECTVVAIKTATSPTDNDMDKIYNIRSIFGIDPTVIIAPKESEATPITMPSLSELLKGIALDGLIKDIIIEKIASIDKDEILLSGKLDKIRAFVADAIKKESNKDKKDKLTAFKSKIDKVTLPIAPTDPYVTFGKLQSVCEKIEAIAFYDCLENEIPDDLKTTTLKIDDELKTPRVMACYPMVKTTDNKNIGMSAYAAGALAKTDLEKGFWSSPSNTVLFGLKELTENISYHESDLDCKANTLNKNQITTVIRDDQWRLWGNQTLHRKESDKHKFYKFLSVVRTQDVINKSIRKGIAQLVDAGISRNLVDMATAMIDQFLSKLQSMGAVVNFSIKPDEKI